MQIILAALLAGLVGSPHCVGMCGGFAAACARPRGGAWLWHLGRLTTYAALGAVGGAVGGALPGPVWVPALVSVPLLLWFSASLAGLLPAGSTRVPPGLARVGATLARRDGVVWRYLFGATTGLLPCGLLYAGLALALTGGSAVVGAAAMVAFGLGTVPALALLSVTLRRFALRGLWQRRLVAVLVLVAALGSVGMRVVGNHHHRADMPMPVPPAGHSVRH